MTEHARFEDIAVPNQRRRWAAGLVLGFAFGVLGFHVDSNRMTPLQRAYLPHYTRASLVAKIAGERTSGPGALSTYSYLECQIGQSSQCRLPAAPSISEDSAARPILNEHATAGKLHSLHWHKRTVLTAEYFRFLKVLVFEGEPVLSVFSLTLWLGGLALFLGTGLGLFTDYRYRRRTRRGIPVRGPQFVDRYAFRRLRKSDATQLDEIGFRTIDPPTLRERLTAPRAQRGVLAIPKKLEEYHTLIMGDTGTGKSVLIRQLLRAIQARGDSAIVYDPAGEFTAEFYNPERGDVILNPLDERCPYWTPTAELETNQEALSLAESLFPDSDSEHTQFFRVAPRAIFAHLIQYNPDPEILAAWLATPAEIDRRVAGTEMAQMINKGAGAQRAGVLASLGTIANSFRLLQPQEKTSRSWAAREWAKERKGWIFFTTKTTTRKAQLPLISMWIDTLILRLMASENPRPVWLVIDELASLQKLPQLSTALTMARKYHLKVVLGFQVKSQLEETYGRYGAETLLSMPATKIFMRTGNPDTAEWISKAIGEQDIARSRETRSSSQGARSGTSESQSWELRTERAVSPAQVQGLRNLHGYLKNENYVVLFTLCVVPAEVHAPAFMPRNDVIEFTQLILPSDLAVAEIEAAGEAATDLTSGASPDEESQSTTEPAADAAASDLRPATASPTASVPATEGLDALDKWLNAAAADSATSPNGQPDGEARPAVDDF